MADIYEPNYRPVAYIRAKLSACGGLWRWKHNLNLVLVNRSATPRLIFHFEKKITKYSGIPLDMGISTNKWKLCLNMGIFLIYGNFPYIWEFPLYMGISPIYRNFPYIYIYIWEFPLYMGISPENGNSTQSLLYIKRMKIFSDLSYLSLVYNMFHRPHHIEILNQRNQNNIEHRTLKIWDKLTLDIHADMPSNEWVWNRCSKIRGHPLSIYEVCKGRR